MFLLTGYEDGYATICEETNGREATRLAKELWDRHATCVICLEEYTQRPLAFPCDHVICYNCVNRLALGSGQQCDKCSWYHCCVKCPMCNDKMYCSEELCVDEKFSMFLKLLRNCYSA